MFGKIPKYQQKELIGYAFAHFPEIFSNSGTKFYRYMSWLATEKSIIDPALRDRFTAGGKKDVELEDVRYEKLPHIYFNLHTYRKAVLKEIKNADSEELEKDWGIVPGAGINKRVKQWIHIVANNIADEGLEHVRKEQMLEDILLDH